MNKVLWFAFVPFRIITTILLLFVGIPGMSLLAGISGTPAYDRMVEAKREGVGIIKEMWEYPR